MRKTLFTLFCICAAHMLVAQTQLPRKAWLGARVEPASYNSAFAIKVVTPVGGTSAALQLQPGDYILSIDGSSFADFDAFTKTIRSSYAGKEIAMEIARNEKKKKLKGVWVGKDLEKDDNAEVIYDAVPYRGGLLRVIINKPNKPGPLPAMLFIPGYTCSSIDNLDATHPYKRIIDAYVDEGYVTLRIEKSGLGDSQNTPDCESCSLTDEIENFEAGLLKLMSLPYVNKEQIILFGHSMGGIVAPALSAKHPVAGVVVYGTTAKSWFEYQIEMNRVQNKLAGMDPMEYEQSVRDQYEVNYRYFVKKEELVELAKDTAMARVLQESWQYDGHGRIFGRNAEYWRQIQDMPLLENWKNTTAQVLVEFGESDFQAFSLADHEQIVNTVNYYHPKHASLRTFPKTDHYFAASGTMQEAFDKFNQGQYQVLFNEYNPEVGKASVEWSNAILNTKTPTAQEPSWKKLNTEAYPGKQDDICFVNRNTGWYVNGYGKIYHTNDGGATWSKQFEKQGTFFRCIAFVDELHGFVGNVGTEYFPNVSDTIPLYQTADGGKTWSPVSYKGPYVKGLCALDIVKEQYINHGNIDYKVHVYGVGRVGSPANLMYSGDGGKTWTSHSMNEECKMLFDIKMFDKDHGIVCAATSEDISTSHALLLKTDDGGKTWKKVYESTRPYETTWKVSFPTDKVGYATVQSYNPDPTVTQQYIVKTEDGGKTWRELPLINESGAREFGIGFLDENHGFVGTMSSGFETKDGGKSWSKIDLGKACNKIRIYQDDRGKYGYSIGVSVMKWE